MLTNRNQTPESILSFHLYKVPKLAKPTITDWSQDIFTFWGRRGFTEKGPEEDFGVASNVLHLGLDGTYNLYSHCENQHIIFFTFVIFSLNIYFYCIKTYNSKSTCSLLYNGKCEGNFFKNV